MIVIEMLGEDYEQDVRPLIKSFFPEEEQIVYHVQEQIILEKSDDDTPPDKISKLRLEFLLKKEEFLIRLWEKGHCLCQELNQRTDLIQSRSRYRNDLHRSLYRLLCQYTSKTLPWGTLTGIRPTKQVLDRLELGESKESIQAFLAEEYYCSEEKIHLSIQVAQREQALLRSIDYKNEYSIYIGIPFCPTTCNYCSFTSYPLERFEREVDPYLQALQKEMEYAKTCFPHKNISTIYVGGGTPTTLKEEQLHRLLSLIRSNFMLPMGGEFTVEAGRPDSITKDKLRILKEYGVNRISINPQSMNQSTLDLIGRKHTTQEVEEAFLMAREEGHENINMDLILGLANETPDDVKRTLERIKLLNPDSLTVHTLALKRAARLTTQRERYSNLHASDLCGMQRLTMEFAKTQEYLPYYLYRQKNMAENLENTGYARKGKEGLYNVLIMEEKHTILALGAGASSKFVFRGNNRIERVENVKSLVDYIQRTEEMIDRKKQFLELYSDDL